MSTTIKSRKSLRISKHERDYLRSGLNQPGGKLPLFDENGQKINATIIEACLNKGLAERWFANPMKPDWMVCRLTSEGRKSVS